MSDISDLIHDFKAVRVLKTDPQTKSLALLGTIDGKDAIINVEKSHFTVEDDISEAFIDDLVNECQIINNNDIYYWYLTSLKQKLPENPGAKLNLIYPATDVHIKKYDEQNYHMVNETAEMYSKFVVPYINTMKGDRIKWVYNILFEGKESETFIHHDTDKDNGFVLLPDMKWDKINMDSLYLCVIVNRTDISSVRDLNGTHVEYLLRIRQQIRTITSEKFPVKKDELRIFIHYQPSYYHFHIHVVNIKHPGLGNGIAVGKAILLDEVIENISSQSDYYQKKSITYVLGESHGLWKDEGYRNAHLEASN